MQEERAERIRLAQETIEKAEKQEKLYIRDEAAKLRKAYNDIHNEGSEGFVPHYYTIDEVEHAKKILEEEQGIMPEQI